jgi:hypothetical protein
MNEGERFLAVTDAIILDGRSTRFYAPNSWSLMSITLSGSCAGRTCPMSSQVFMNNTIQNHAADIAKLKIT